MITMMMLMAYGAGLYDYIFFIGFGEVPSGLIGGFVGGNNIPHQLLIICTIISL